MPRADIRRILCPTDFSPVAEAALRHAVALARWYDARLVVLHVLAAPPPPAGMFQAYAGPLQPGSPAEHRLLQALDRFTRPAEAAGIPTETHLREGNIAHTILELAEAHPADLLVMGTHGRGGFQRLVLGSVTEKVLRQAPCPVLTVPPAAAKDPVSGPLFSRILCPVDLLGDSERALQYALSLAQEAKASLELLHVVEVPPDPLAPEMIGRFELPELRRSLEKDARRRLQDMVPAEARDWCDVKQTLSAGKPWQEVLRLSAGGAADLIVMGVRGRGALDVALFGSNTQHVVRAADCPVLTVRDRAARAAHLRSAS
jgi:nucleotide-binding universal stress UspA family protein